MSAALETRHTVYLRPNGNLACDKCDATWREEPAQFCADCDTNTGPFYGDTAETHSPVAWCFSCTQKAHTRRVSI